MKKEIEIEFKGITLRVEGIYEPEEQMVRYYPDGDGYPGSPSNFDIEGIYAADSEIDIYDLLPMRDIEEIEDEIINKIEER